MTRCGTMLFITLLLLVWTPVHGQPEERCFAETDFCISGRLHEYWEQNGGLPVFGFPITPQREEVIEGVPLQVQWFERNRLELHPDLARPYDVLLGRLGAELTTGSGVDAAADIDCQRFAETTFRVCGTFLDAWRADGLEFDGQTGTSVAESTALFGLPISNAHYAQLSDGSVHLIQWFERTRFELHAENQPPYNVLLGRLGSEQIEGLPVVADPLPSEPRYPLPPPNAAGNRLAS